MSGAKLEAVPHPRDALIAALRQKLIRLFDGLTVKNVAAKFDWIDVSVFGQAEDLLRHGLVNADMLRQLSARKFKVFRSVPSLGRTHYVYLRRGKTGVGFSTSWYVSIEGEADVWRSAPLWIQSELRALALMTSVAERSSDASNSRKNILDPTEWKKVKADGFGRMIDLACRCAVDTDSMFECVAPGWRINSDDQHRFETRVDQVIAELKEQFLAIRFEGSDGPRQNAPARRLSLVIDNT